MPVKTISYRRRLIIAALIVLVSAATFTAWAQGEACQITWPREEAVLSGVVKVRGSSTHPNFWKYELAAAPEGTDDWRVLTVSEHQVIEGTLALWDTTAFPDGRWQLRLRTVDRSGNYLEQIVRNLIIANKIPTPTPTPTPTPMPSPSPTPRPAPTPTVIVRQPKATATPTPPPIPPRATPTLPRGSLGRLTRAFVNGGLAALLLCAVIALLALIRHFWHKLLAG